MDIVFSVHFEVVALVERDPTWIKMECCIHTNCLMFKENLRHPQKYNQPYFKPFSGPFEPKEQPQNAEKYQYPEYLLFFSPIKYQIGHNYKADKFVISI